MIVIKIIEMETDNRVLKSTPLTIAGMIIIIGAVKYAELLVRTGVNIQKGQSLVITSPIECVEFTRVVSVKAYEAGAREVFIRWGDAICTNSFIIRW